MDKKCGKYEALFTFSDDATLKKHISECDECKKEHENMEKISALIQEVKPYYRKKQNVLTRVKAACVLFAILFGGVAFSALTMNTDITDTIKYGTTLSSGDLGFPVDSYGLLMVE